MIQSVETVLQHLNFELLSARETWLTVPAMVGGGVGTVNPWHSGVFTAAGGFAPLWANASVLSRRQVGDSRL